MKRFMVLSNSIVVIFVGQQITEISEIAESLLAKEINQVCSVLWVLESMKIQKQQRGEMQMF